MQTHTCTIAAKHNACYTCTFAHVHVREVQGSFPHVNPCKESEVQHTECIKHRLLPGILCVARYTICIEDYL